MSSSLKFNSAITAIKTPVKGMTEYNEFDLTDIRRIQIYFRKYLRNNLCKDEKNAFSKKLKKYRQRMYQIDELVQTEQNYVSNLCTLIDKIKKPLEKRELLTE